MSSTTYGRFTIYDGTPTSEAGLAINENFKAVEDALATFTLPMTTSAATGIIWKDTNRFIHNFQHPTGSSAIPEGQNTFVGVDAGNFTMGSAATTASQGSRNVGVGYQALVSLTTGYRNLALGRQALYHTSTGYSNVGIGEIALHQLTSGYDNIGIGQSAGRQLPSGGINYNTTGNRSIFIGVDTKPADNGQTNQIVIGHGAEGHGSNTVRLGNTSITDVHTSGTINAQGYKSSNGTVGATEDVAVAKVGEGTRTLHFKSGLYTGYTDS